MRDISAIRNQSLRRENKIEAPDPHTPLTQENITSPDQERILTLEKSGLKKSLTIQIRKKQTELKDLIESIAQLQLSSKNEAARIVKEARDLASDLISKAQADNNTAENILKKNKIKENELIKQDAELTKREETSAKQEELAEIKMAEATKKEAESAEILEQSRQQNEITVELFVTTTALLQVAVEHLLQLQKLKNNAQNDVSQLFDKASKMIDRTAVLLKEIDTGRLLNDKKAIELQDQKAGLVDREQMLERTAREVNNGRRNISS